MDNYVIFSAARTGSTYLAGAVAKQIRCLEPNLFYGGELFHWEEYFQLSPSATVGPGALSMLEKNPLLLDEYEQSQPKGEATHIFMGKGGYLERNNRETEWNERAPVNFRRAWEESQRRLTLLENSYFPWVIKVHANHLHCLDMFRFNRLVQRDNTKTVLLYRSFLWDWFLSYVAVRRTGIFQQSQRGNEWNKPELKTDILSKDFLQTWYIHAREFLNMALSYRRLADHIVPYEGFSGDPRRDAGSITGIDLFPDAPHQVKLWNKKEKEQMIANIDEVKTLFLAYCKVLGYSGGKMFL
ncbi:MAG: hypothetical protein GY774_38410 [Planctomycetes bacterium]|nr:hypothetical protein [Planctomycetota bacterium]